MIEVRYRTMPVGWDERASQLSDIPQRQTMRSLGAE
jgi:hypothetical protein